MDRQARSDPSPSARPRNGARPGRQLAADEIGAVWTYAQTVLAALALVFCTSWHPSERVAAGAFAVADPALASHPLPVNVTVLPNAERVSAAIEAAWRARASRVEQARSTVRLSDAVLALVPESGEMLVVDPETLWLARCMYSESNLPHEQELVAWVVRNRVATGYRGRRTYRDVVLDPQQFSAFNYDSGRRAYYASLMPWSPARGWRRTLAIAAYVRRAPWSKRPFEVGVRHFYSEISMVGKRAPVWAIGQRPVRPNRLYPVDPYRFRFLALREGVRQAVRRLG